MSSLWASFWQQIKERPEWVRITVLGYGMNAVLLAGVLFVGQFRPLGLVSSSMGFSLLQPIQVAVAFLIYLILSGTSLWFGKKWGLVLSLLFPGVFVCLGLFGLFKFWFIPSLIVLFLYVVATAFALRKGMKLFDVVKNLFAISFVLMILMVAFIFWSEQSSNFPFFAFAFYGGMHWVWQLVKLWKDPFFGKP